MRSLKVAELIRRTLEVLDDSPLSIDEYSEIEGSAYNSEQIYEAINRAIIAYCKKRSSACRTSAQVLIATDGEIAIPRDIVRSVNNVYVGGVRLFKSDQDFESIINSDWETESGTAAKYWVNKDNAVLALTPIVAAWSGGTTYATVHYTQLPKVYTSLATQSIVTGRWYEIHTAGTEDFTLYGAADSVVETQFLATSSTTLSDGYAQEVIDHRITTTDQDTLKYLSVSSLLQLAAHEPESGEAAIRYEKLFYSRLGGE